MWKISVHRLVWEEDFAKMDKSVQNTILRTIYKKLSIDPQGYGEPLRRGLKGFWKLKISDYRVIYAIEKQEVKVLVLKVGMRRDEQVYRSMMNRLNKL